jgi:hypothetical protein
VRRRPGFLIVPYQFFDSAVAGAVGREAWMVYLMIRRFEQRRPYTPTIGRLLDEGYLVAYANQTKIAVLLGMSRSSVTRSVRMLKAIGWIDDVRLKDNGRAYKVGFISDPDKEGRVQSVYWADEWLEQTLASLPKHMAGWQHVHAIRRRAELVARLQRIIDMDGAGSVRLGKATVTRSAPISTSVAASGRRR